MYPNPARNTNPRFFIFAQIFFSGKGLCKHVLPASCPRALGPGGLPDLPVHPVRRQKSQMAGNHERGLPRKKNLIVFHSDFFFWTPPFRAYLPFGNFGTRLAGPRPCGGQHPDPLPRRALLDSQCPEKKIFAKIKNLMFPVFLDIRISELNYRCAHGVPPYIKFGAPREHTPLQKAFPRPGSAVTPACDESSDKKKTNPGRAP